MKKRTKKLSSLGARLSCRRALSRRAFPFALLFLSGCQSGPCQLGLATEIPLTFQDGHLLAAPLLNGVPVSMWLDTGAQMTTLRKASAERLSLPLMALNGTVEGVGGSSLAYGFTARSFQIGRLSGHNFKLFASDLGLSRPGPETDGLLGADFLGAYDLDLDLQDHKAILFKPVSGCSKPTAALGGDLYVVPMVTSGLNTDPRAHVRVTIAGKTLTALVDTGAPNSLLFRNAARRIGLAPSALAADPHFRAGGTGPATRNAVRHVLAPVQIGELTVFNLPVAIIDQAGFPDADMLLGLDFLSRVHTWFSFSSNTLVLQYPALASSAVK